MSSKVRNSIVGTAILIFVFVYSYGNFSSFKPKSLIPLKEVKSIKIEEDTVKKIRLPYPRDHQIIGKSYDDDGDHITYKTTQSPEGIQTFYRNVLISQDWEIDTTGSADIFTTTKYKLSDQRVAVTTSIQENKDQENEEITIVSLTIKN